MERHVLLKLRVAINTDFADQFGNKKNGVAYFCKNSIGVIEQKINYFTNQTDLTTFKNLYANGQIYVIKNPHDPESIFNCIDWDLVDKELNYELKKLDELKK